ncbi:hypothetical protein GCM10027578_26010 [Spirosoma luteolum]
MTTTPHPVHNLIVLDQSGSMHALTDAVLAGFDEVLHTIRTAQETEPTQAQFVSLVTFGSRTINTLIASQPVAHVRPLDPAQYRPHGSTPLYDALGHSLLRLERQLDGQGAHTALITVITDGMENASTDYSGPEIKRLIERLTRQHDWVFTYMGANHAVDEVAGSLAIQAHLTFTSDRAGLRDMFRKDSSSRAAFYKKRSQGMSGRDATTNFFD